MFKVRGLNLSNVSNVLKYNKNQFKFNFSTKEAVKTIQEASKGTNADLFQRNFRLDTPPEKFVAYNDNDLSMAAEVFSKIDLENLSTVPLFSGRFSRFYCLTEDTIHHLVMFITHDLNMGIGTAILFLAAALRIVFIPNMLKGIKNHQINRLLYPEVLEHQERIKKIKAAGDHKLMFLENKKLSQLKENFGVKQSPLQFVFSIAQVAVLACWAGLIQRFAYNIEDYPEMMTGGFLWFKDLSLSDPFMILPIINSGGNTMYANDILLKVRRVLFLPPLFTLPIMCTLESGIVLYVTAIASFQACFVLLSNSNYMKKRFGTLNYLPGSKLEKINRPKSNPINKEDNVAIPSEADKPQLDKKFDLYKEQEMKAKEKEKERAANQNKFTKKVVKLK